MHPISPYIYPMKKLLLFPFLALMVFCSNAQLLQHKNTFTHADTLRGTITPERAWWNVLRYDITVKPDYFTKSISGKNIITYLVEQDNHPDILQIDLQEPLIIDSIFLKNNIKTSFTQEGNAFHVRVPKQNKNSREALTVYYHGVPREAKRAPWDGGWIWTKDSLGRPWMTVACQGLGASVWYPCKDHQSDEPDNGASLTIVIPDTLVGVGNGRLINKKTSDRLTSYTWEVKSPINNYDIIPYIGKYVNYNEVYNGEKGKLDLGFWVLDYNLERSKQHSLPNVLRMLKALEYWFGPYPFYEDSYKLVDAPHLGMEHQSAIAYGNHYLNGYLGRDLSHSGEGLKWDFIIVHESAHEWFGNNITSKDLADMWIHESFANYSETLFTEFYSGKKAGNDYVTGVRKNITNEEPIIGAYGVNKEGSQDMYYKGGNMLQTIRHSINNDEKFRQILRGLTKTFYHQTVTTQQIENYISKQAGFNYSKVFDQYLRTTKIPVIEYKVNVSASTVDVRWSNCVDGFNLPIVITPTGKKIFVTTQTQTIKLNAKELAWWNQENIETMFYVKAEDQNG
ncbi:MAG: M1 family metallopeptidase [Chitinophagaceae bacterium]|jgi:aminopeptidase N|nr:M1 family metallopeptidase [Chitinophagaceae bacterium]